MASDLKLPYQWHRRSYQENLWKYLASGGKRAVAVWHRRAGKDEVCLHHTACAAHERIGNYWHMLPEYSQARKAIWDSVNPHTGKRRIDEAFPRSIRAFTREHEMTIGFANGSTWQVVGSDNYSSLMGTAPAGMVLSEYALSNPSTWSYLSPILMENNGWAVFISTPRGKNHFYNLLKSAQRQPEWFSEILTNDDTHVFTPEQMDEELERLSELHGAEYGRSLWRQEYFSSFDAVVIGSIWGDCVDAAEREKRITHGTSVPVETDIPVHTAWDLGYTDDTAIWWFQLMGGEIRVIDCFSASGKDIEFYCNVLRSKARERGFTYGTHWLPHDARPRTLASGGKSILQQMHDQKVGRCAIVPRLDREEGIQAARVTFRKCWFDGDRCEKGLEALRQYHREWDDEKKAFSLAPKHDFSSHYCDAWRYLSLSWRQANPKVGETSLIDRLKSASITGQTFGELKKGFFRRKRHEREMLGSGE